MKHIRDWMELQSENTTHGVCYFLFYFFILIIRVFPYQVWESDLILGSEKISSDWTLSQHAALKQQDFAAVKYSSKMLEVRNSRCCNTFAWLRFRKLLES
jgi:hypothetical protein